MARLGIDLYNISSEPEDLQNALSELRSDFDSHTHDGSSGRSFETLLLDTLRARTISIKKGAYDDSTGGLWEGIDSGVLKMNIGDATNYLKWSGSALTIVGTIQTSETGERIVFDAANDNLDMINSSAHTVVQFNYGTTETTPLLDIHVQDNRRIGVKVTTDAITGTGISHSIMIDCDANDNAIFGLDIDRDGTSDSNLFGATISAANAGAGSAIALDLNAATGLRITNASVKGIDIGTTANGITITQTGTSNNSSLLITNSSTHIDSFGLWIELLIFHQSGPAG